MQRVVDPEILDDLDPQDPRAIRSRTDLRRINRMMGNDAWLCREVAQLHASGLQQVVELGAGDGHLARQLLDLHPGLQITAVDLQEPAPELSNRPRLSWLQGDALELPVDCSQAIVISNLFLHHLEPTALCQLGGLLQSAAAILACEPERRGLHLIQARLAAPFVNPVTRHDMAVSIRAGFRGRELVDHLDVPGSWHWQQHRSWLGAHRLKGVRQ